MSALPFVIVLTVVVLLGFVAWLAAIAHQNRRTAPAFARLEREIEELLEGEWHQ